MSSPQTVVALLRGINLGSHNRVAMADLRELVEEVGGEDVRTYLQSGNVVFRSPEKPAELEATLAQGIKRALGIDVSVVVRTKRQLQKMVADNPFAKADAKTLHVALLAAKPKAPAARKLLEGSFEPDRVELAGREVYLHCPNRYGRTKLSNSFIEKQLGVRATTRNWKTITSLAELAQD
ncbi:MAG: hypothetical protein QOE36_3358 [Gaiellaceae bacterium]|nr:hypothetical protein [Gaiellaceae bacterium]